MSAKPIHIPTPAIVTAYLCAIVVSNIIVARWGQPALVVTAFVLIPFDFVARDILHGRWRDDKLWIRIGGLVVIGGAITVALNLEALRVASASVAAFGLGVVVNTLLYSLLWPIPRFKRMVATNSVVSAIDSVVFPLLAFGSVSIMLSLAQCLSKAVGAVVWAGIVTKVNIE